MSLPPCLPGHEPVVEPYVRPAEPPARSRTHVTDLDHDRRGPGDLTGTPQCAVRRRVRPERRRAPGRYPARDLMSRTTPARRGGASPRRPSTRRARHGHGPGRVRCVCCATLRCRVRPPVPGRPPHGAGRRRRAGPLENGAASRAAVATWLHGRRRCGSTRPATVRSWAVGRLPAHQRRWPAHQRRWPARERRFPARRRRRRSATPQPAPHRGGHAPGPRGGRP